MVKREPQTIERRCELCESYCARDDNVGECRNDPPTHVPAIRWPGDTELFGWPPTRKDLWCGSFISKGPNHPNLTIYPA